LDAAGQFECLRTAHPQEGGYELVATEEVTLRGALASMQTLSLGRRCVDRLVAIRVTRREVGEGIHKKMRARRLL
jgi:hypothetical protein